MQYIRHCERCTGLFVGLGPVCPNCNRPGAARRSKCPDDIKNSRTAANEDPDLYFGKLHPEFSCKTLQGVFDHQCGLCAVSGQTMTYTGRLDGDGRPSLTNATVLVRNGKPTLVTLKEFERSSR